VGIALGGVGARNALDKLGIDIKKIIPWLTQLNKQLQSNNIDLIEYAAKQNQEKSVKTGVIHMTGKRESDIANKIGE
jgi:hypothetical protein